MTIQDSSILA
jgi:hypothetical protein